MTSLIWPVPRQVAECTANLAVLRDAFDNNKRSCRERLLKHNARRRRRGSAPMHSNERSQATDEMEQDDEEAPATSDSKLQLVSTASDVPAQPPHQATIA
ncbi:hypothetical protein HaLaN_11079, partial [Haematococcus lacustris]